MKENFTLKSVKGTQKKPATWRKRKKIILEKNMDTEGS